MQVTNSCEGSRKRLRDRCAAWVCPSGGVVHPELLPTANERDGGRPPDHWEGAVARKNLKLSRWASLSSSSLENGLESATAGGRASTGVAPGSGLAGAGAGAEAGAERPSRKRRWLWAFPGRAVCSLGSSSDATVEVDTDSAIGCSGRVGRRIGRLG